MYANKVSKSTNEFRQLASTSATFASVAIRRFADIAQMRSLFPLPSVDVVRDHTVKLRQFHDVILANMDEHDKLTRAEYQRHIEVRQEFTAKVDHLREEIALRRVRVLTQPNFITYLSFNVRTNDRK